MAIELRVVSDEMFDAGTDALTLYAFDVTDCDARGEERVFAEALKVSSVHWRAINVYTRSQQKVNAFSTCVASNFGAHALSQHGIPSSRKRNAPGHNRCWSKIANADWAVCHLQSR